MKHIIIKVFFLSLLVSLSCVDREAVEKENEVEDHSHSTSVLELSLEQEERLGIVLGDVIRKPTLEFIETSGTMELPPSGRQKVTQLMGGYIRKMNLLPGQKVWKGQELCVIENPEFVSLQQRYLSAKAREKAVAADFNRQEELLRTQATSTQATENARAAFEGNQIELNALERQLEMLGISTQDLSVSTMSSSVVIRAPFSGYIDVVNINPGQFVGSEQILFELINPKEMHAHIKVFEQDISKVMGAEEVQIFQRSRPDEICKGEVFLIEPSVSAEGSVGIHVDLIENHLEHLQAGMFIRAKIQIRGDSAWTIPETAILTESNEGKEATYILVETQSSRYSIQAVEVIQMNESDAVIEKFWSDEAPRIVERGARKMYSELQDNDGGGHSH